MLFINLLYKKNNCIKVKFFFYRSQIFLLKNIKSNNIFNIYYRAQLNVLIMDTTVIALFEN